MVILAVAIIVLLAVVAFFMGAFVPGGEEMRLATEFRSACAAWVQTGCAGDVPKGVEDACDRWKAKNPAVDCSDSGIRLACGCGGVTPGGGTVTMECVECRSFVDPNVVECVPKDQCPDMLRGGPCPC
jgi:hypothetical protein